MDLPDSGIELGSPALQVDSLPTKLSGKPPQNYTSVKNMKFKIKKKIPLEMMYMLVAEE